jgi:hypothetical protein
MSTNLEQLIQDLHDSDQHNGVDVEGRCASLTEAAEWLRQKAVEFYPDSVFAKRHRRGFG